MRGVLLKRWDEFARNALIRRKRRLRQISIARAVAVMHPIQWCRKTKKIQNMGKRRKRGRPEDQEQPKINRRLFDKALERARRGPLLTICR